jgi:osmotically inducible protein OsmC
MKKIYETAITNIGGREGEVHSADNSFSYAVTSPGRKKDNATNPEQLFAAAYSACFNSALEMVLEKEGIQAESTVTARVSLYQDEEGGFNVGVQLETHIEGVSEEQAHDLVEKAHQVCPYSRATRNNIEVDLVIV